MGFFLAPPMYGICIIFPPKFSKVQNSCRQKNEVFESNFPRPLGDNSFDDIWCVF